MTTTRLLVIVALLCPSAWAQTAADPAPGGPGDSVTLSRTLVLLHATVLDRHGRNVPGLAADRFAIREDGVAQQLAFFGAEDVPASIGIVFDLSGSMEKRVHAARLALKRFVETSHPEDEYFLVGFGDRPELLKDFTTEGGDIVNAVTLATPEGGTALLDAVALAVAKVQGARHRKRALVIVSDGEDNQSRYTYRELAEIVKESDALVYSVGISDPFAKAVEPRPGLVVVDPHRTILSSGKIVLKRISVGSGGRAYFPENQDELVDACREIALELRSQYGIGYYPSGNARDGRYHTIRVTVKTEPGSGRLVVRARDGYWGLPPAR